MKSRGLAVLLPLLLLAFVTTGAVLYLRYRAERRYESAVAPTRDWYYGLPLPEEFRERRGEFLEVSEGMLGHRSRRPEIRQDRLSVFLLSLDPAGLQQEVRTYAAEQASFSNKDPIFLHSQMLLDCWLMPVPDSVERARIENLKAQSMSFDPLVEREWYRGALLRRYVGAKRLLQEPAKAQAELNTLLEYAPWFAQAWYVRGRARLAQGDAAGAILDFQEAARLDPARPEVFRWTAQAFEVAGKPVLAAAEIRRAFALQPDYPEAREIEERLK